MITKNNLRDKFIKELPKQITKGEFIGYAEWLEQLVVNGDIATHSYDPDYCEVDCKYYELEQGMEDNDEICHLGIGIENCSHCYKNKALYKI